jgi:hypothetical protein
MFKEYDIQYRYAASLGEEDSAYDPDTKEEEQPATAEGYLKVFDVKVELRPVELAPVNIAASANKK